MITPDAIVIGAGPNGLVAANYLAQAGWSVLVLEAQRRPGGAVWTEESTLPGFLHDVGAAFFPFGPTSPALLPLDLHDAGLVWRHAPLDSAHPAKDGTCAAIGRDLDASKQSLGEDGPAWEKLARWHAQTRDGLLDALLSTLPAAGQMLRFGPANLLRLAAVAASSGRGYAERTFRTEPARRIIPALALHTDVGPDDPFGAIVGFMLAMLASSGGFAIPEGGAISITRALIKRLEQLGGVVRTGARVKRIVVREGRAAAVVTEQGEEIEADRAIIADTSAPALYLRLLDPDLVPTPLAESMRNFKHGFGTFKMDWALSGPVPWSCEDAARSAVVHTGDSLDDLARFTAEVRRGELPEDPYLVIGQQTLADPTRAPAGKHTLWAYSRVPPTVPGGWEAVKQSFADRIETRIEELAPGFKKRVLARVIVTPPDLEAMDENLLGGDLGGGSAQIQHQLFFRPVFPYFRYRTPIRALYLGSSYTHPGAGVHGACGRNAAEAALRDEG
ncbi:phytoene desaturase family protein [Polyangium jinanense]|uniref:Pyridine nucleotide-disulfide oxidoreductase domain-containing protein 2 n=1 Tax=Polyangium jinanense TaxID=2829994 RepID=A0A9X3X7P9_9BACT|nr:NAD(P)/FAD-dependent oxidoreductase [Polyangium jinanense]MDC3958700.1 NAD(P)/FAD-dependent oxidoreductase [Polyangium jinanense]MDC3985319.1 NAD(P)/FAD-dependent oxidoreductase [Polyangium jinanense]